MKFVSKALDTDIAASAADMTDRIPNQYEIKNISNNPRKPKKHKYPVKSSSTGKVYWNPVVYESFSTYLINESSALKYDEQLTALPEAVIGELKKLIKKGASDLNQNWENAAELVNTAYHISRIRRPTPEQRGAWKQYEELIRVGVQSLYANRGATAGWRSSSVMYAESTSHPIYEGSRFFVKIPGSVDTEIEAASMGEVITQLTNKFRHKGIACEVKYRTEHGAVLHLTKNQEELDEIVIQEV
jgi:hypothetical protein